MSLETTVSAALAEYERLAPDSQEVLASIRTRIDTNTPRSATPRFARRVMPALAAAAVFVLITAVTVAVRLGDSASDTSTGRPPIGFGPNETRPLFRYNVPTRPGDLIPVAQRERAESFTVPLLGDAGSFTLAEHRHQVVVLTWSASWCGPCRTAYSAALSGPTLQSATTDVLTIATKDERSSALTFFRPSATSPIGFDVRGTSLTALRELPTVLPTTVLIDRDQLVAAVYTSAVSNALLAQAVERLAHS